MICCKNRNLTVEIRPGRYPNSISGYQLVIARKDRIANVREERTITRDHDLNGVARETRDTTERNWSGTASPDGISVRTITCEYEDGKPAAKTFASITFSNNSQILLQLP